MSDRKIQQRYDTAANFTTSNRLLLAGEKAIESDTLREKVGDGTTEYNNLPYSDEELTDRMDALQAAYQISDKDRIVQIGVGGFLTVTDGESELLKVNDGKLFLYSKTRGLGIDFLGYFVGTGLPESDFFEADGDVWYAFYMDNDTDRKYLVFSDRVNATHPFCFTQLRETIELKAGTGIPNDDNVFLPINDLAVNVKADVLYRVETYLVFESVGATQQLQTRFTTGGGNIVEQSLYLEATGISTLKTGNFLDTKDTPFTNAGEIKALKYDGLIKLDEDALVSLEFRPKTSGHEFNFKQFSWVRFTQIG